jgi:hypothetical protein
LCFRAVNYFGQIHNVGGVILALPLLVVVITMLYLGDNHAVIRCGQFIRQHIETEAPSVKGWEAWLEDYVEQGTRTTERWVMYGVSLLLLLYFVGSVSLAWPVAKGEYGAPVAVALTSLYGVIGATVGVFFAWSMKLSTTTPEEREAAQRKPSK